MHRGLTFGFSATVLMLAVLACANPFGTSQPPAPDNVQTIVASTFAALTAPAPAATPPAAPSLLPHSLYFLNNDSAALAQVFRRERDGTTIHQITLEPVKVDGYDVSLVDGSVAYVSGNQLLMINADGTDRKVLVTGGEIDPETPFTTSIWSPAWSPNGETIAYGHGGLTFYSVATGVSNRVLENQIREINGLVFPDEMYWPERYSADGTKLLITLGYYENASSAIYYPSANALVRLSGEDSADVCCSANWTPDGTALYAALSTVGMVNPGLWRVDAATGAVTTLIKGFVGGGNYNFAGYPSLGPDGQLYYFYAENKPESEFGIRPPLQMVRSAADGVTGRAVLRPESFNNMNEALWSPDASFVIVAMAPIPDVYQGGKADLYYVGGGPPIPLAPFALQMKWGP